MLVRSLPDTNNKDRLLSKQVETNRSINDQIFSSNCGKRIAFDHVNDLFFSILDTDRISFWTLPQELWKCDFLKATTNSDPAQARIRKNSPKSPRLHHCPIPSHQCSIVILFT